MTKAQKQALLKRLQAAQKLRLGEIRLLAMQCKLGQLRADELPGHVKQTIRYGVQTAAEPPGANVVLSLAVMAFYDAETTDEPAILIRANYVANYVINSPIAPKKLLGQTACHVATMNIYPYWRELVQATTTRMGIPPLTLPLIPATDMIKDIKLEKPKPPQKTE
jgi:hypothetical protein